MPRIYCRSCKRRRERSDNIVRVEVAVAQLELESLAENLASRDSTGMSSELMIGVTDHNSAVAKQQVNVIATSGEGCDEGNMLTVAGDVCICRARGTRTRGGVMSSRSTISVLFMGAGTSSIGLKKLLRSTVSASSLASMRFIRVLFQRFLISQHAVLLEKAFERFIKDWVDSCQGTSRLLLSHHPIMVLP